MSVGDLRHGSVTTRPAAGSEVTNQATNRVPVPRCPAADRGEWLALTGMLQSLLLPPVSCLSTGAAFLPARLPADRQRGRPGRGPLGPTAPPLGGRGFRSVRSLKSFICAVLESYISHNATHLSFKCLYLYEWTRLFIINKSRSVLQMLLFIIIKIITTAQINVIFLIF